MAASMVIYTYAKILKFNHSYNFQQEGTMNYFIKEFELFTEKVAAQGLDLAKVKSDLKAQVIETPSWGYANSGTRFQAFPWPGAAVTIK
jgi:L-rhamnose isomerase